MTNSQRYMLVGYVDSGYIGPGFRIPVFQYNEMLFLQESTPDAFNERVIDYIIYDQENNPAVVIDDTFNVFHTNFDSSIHGGRPCFVFITGDDDVPVIFGTRDQIAGRLRHAITSSSSINPLLRIEVLYFLGSPKGRIKDAIVDGHRYLLDQGASWADEWQHEELGRLSTEYQELSRAPLFQADCGTLDNIDLQSIEAKLDNYNFERFQKRHAIQRDISQLRRILSSLKLTDASATARCGRLALANIALVDMVTTPLDPLRIFLRITYAKCCVNLVTLHNNALNKKANRSPAPFQPLDKGNIERFATGDSETLFRDLFRLVAQACAQPSARGTPKPRTLAVAVVADWERGTISTLGQTLQIQDKLKPVVFFNSGLGRGEEIFVNIAQNGVTAKGPQYIESFFEIFFPPANDADLEIYMGASNSWATIFMNIKSCNRILSGDGWIVRQMTTVLGLRRMTIVQKLSATSAAPSYEVERSKLAHFVNNSWRDVRIEDNGKYDCTLVIKNARVPNSTIVPLQQDITFDPRKIITFYSMLMKIFGDKFKFRFINRIGPFEEEIVSKAFTLWNANRSSFASEAASISEIEKELSR